MNSVILISKGTEKSYDDIRKAIAMSCDGDTIKLTGDITNGCGIGLFTRTSEINTIKTRLKASIDEYVEANGGVIANQQLSILKASIDNASVTELDTCIKSIIQSNIDINLDFSKLLFKSITIDFNGFKYYFTRELVCSNTTENRRNQGFHIEESLDANGNNIESKTFTLKNGTLLVGEKEDPNASDCKMMIQNYCNLILENMTIDFGDSSYTYCVSNNHGKIKIINSTINTKKIAFDMYLGFLGRKNVEVSVEGNSIINGNIEIAKDTKAAPENASLKLELKSGRIASGKTINIPKSNTDYFTDDDFDSGKVQIVVDPSFKKGDTQFTMDTFNLDEGYERTLKNIDNMVKFVRNSDLGNQEDQETPSENEPIYFGVPSCGTFERMRQQYIINQLRR